MKKFLAMMFLAVSLMFVGSQDNQAEAARHPIYCPNNNEEAHLVQESIEGSKNNFSCTVLTYHGEHIHYHFYMRNGKPYYTNSWGGAAYVYESGSPIAKSIWEWVQENYQDIKSAEKN